MNMHCSVAVARCRVQTRRYHCLINHIQSHRPTLCHLPPFPFTVLFLALIIPLADPQRSLAVSSLWSSLHVFSLSLSFPAFPQFHSFALSSLPTSPAAIDTNLRNFFGASTCHRVTAHSRPSVCSMCARDIPGGRETREKYRVNEPR